MRPPNADEADRRCLRHPERPATQVANMPCQKPDPRVFLCEECAGDTQGVFEFLMRDKQARANRATQLEKEAPEKW